MSSAREVLMIRPHGFKSNSETAIDNAFQRLDYRLTEDSASIAVKEFDAFANKLTNAGIVVHLFEDFELPDACFPNNWISFHERGTMVLYPMKSPLRRAERKQNIINHFKPIKVLDLSNHENQNEFLEGTGSMVLDRKNRIAYACVSDRTNADLFRKWCALMNYEHVSFQAESDGKAIYHTNVLMTIGENLTLICLDVIDPKHRSKVLATLENAGHTILAIDAIQMRHFAGNMLELENNKGDSIMAMSSGALDALDDDQIRAITKYSTIVDSDLTTIEKLGGGSARCMIAEVFSE